MALESIVSLMYFYLPGAVANMSAVIGSKIPFIGNSTPLIDANLKLNGKQLIGTHKRWGPAFFGVLTGLLFGVLKYHIIDPQIPVDIIIDLAPNQVFGFYSLMSIGAISGDILKSIVKRQLGIKPHKPWIPFDEIDHTTCSLLLVKLFFPIPWRVIIGTIVIIGIIHPCVNVIGYVLKIKKVPY